MFWNKTKLYFKIVFVRSSWLSEVAWNCIVNWIFVFSFFLNLRNWWNSKVKKKAELHFFSGSEAQTVPESGFVPLNMRYEKKEIFLASLNFSFFVLYKKIFAFLYIFFTFAALYWSLSCWDLWLAGKNTQNPRWTPGKKFALQSEPEWIMIFPVTRKNLTFYSSWVRWQGRLYTENPSQACN